MYRTLVILRHTFIEAVVQPIYSLLLALGGLVLFVFAFLPFFTLGEDTVMFKAVGLDVIVLLILITTLFATSKSIFDEIEDRTMLTLMSKPVSKWQVLIGKYLGIVLSAALGVALLGAILVIGTWWRIPNDYLLRTTTLDVKELKQIADLRLMHTAGLYPSLILAWLQISVLAAVGVALSTRFSLVVNLPAVIFIYIAGNLTRFLFPLDHFSAAIKPLLFAIGTILPFLQTFDMQHLAIYSEIKLAGTQFANSPNGVYLSTLWKYLAIAAAYGVAYAMFALSAGMLSFNRRELGGSEG